MFMYPSIKNLVFEGGGILGVTYLGVLDYLDEISVLLVRQQALLRLA